MLDFEVKSKVQPVGERKGADGVLRTGKIATEVDEQDACRAYRARNLAILAKDLVRCD